MPFNPGRTDASQAQTDIESFGYLEPVADGFRNYQKARFSVPAEALLIDQAQRLTLTAPESEVSTTTDYRASRRVVGHERWLVSLWIPLLFFLRNNLGIMAQAFEAKK